MSWTGIGLTSGHFSPPRSFDIIAPGLPRISPSTSWDGTAASGFASTPTDPTRTTAKPALRLLVPPFQWFTDTLDVGVIAAANDGGTLATDVGIEEVTFHYEGNTATVDAPRWHTIQTQVGARTYFGWWVQLKKTPGETGEAQLYVEATARDATMQKRVIGPFLFSPQDSLHDLELEIAATPSEIPGERYKTVAAAAVYARSQSSKNPLVTITEAGLYDLTDPSGATQYDNSGYLNITASVPGVVFGKAAYTDDRTARLVTPRAKLHIFGANITIDYENVLNLDAPLTGNGQFNWFDGITITRSSGRDTLYRGGNAIDLGQNIAGRPYYTECNISETHNAVVGSALTRGCTCSNLGLDIASQSWCIVQSSFGPHNDQFWNSDIPAFTVRYTGSESTATIARRGGTEGFNQGDGTGLYRVTIGATNHDFFVDNGSNDNYLDYLDDKSVVDGYFFADVVEWLNTLPDVTATLLIDPDRRAVSGCLAGGKGQGFGFPANTTSVTTPVPQDIKAAPLTIYSMTDKHGDFYQHRVGLLDNVIVFGNTVVDAQIQGVFLCPIKQSGVAGHSDVFFLGNGFYISEVLADYYDFTQSSSQWGRPDVVASHIVLAHNTWANQRVLIRTDNAGFTADDYCLFKNNTMVRFSWAAIPFDNFTIDGLHIHAGNLIPAEAVRVRVGGSTASLFVDAAAGDFTPAGELLNSGFPAGLPFDRTRTAFAAIAAPGSVAVSAAEYVVPPASENPLGDLLALLSAAGGVSSLHDFALATVESGVWASQDQSGNNNRFTQSTASRQPALLAGRASFDGGDVIFQPIVSGIYTVVFDFEKNNASTVGNMLIDQGQTSLATYQQGNTARFEQVVRVNGDIVTTRGALFSALHEAGRVVVSVEGANFTGDTQIGIARPTAGIAGIVRRVIVINESDMAERLVDARKLAHQVAALP